jgi:RimJ/RimL family protein N-acetyltransferase
MGLTIREAVESDAPALRDYVERLFAEDLPGIFRHSIPTLEEEVAFVRSRLLPSNSTLLIAEVDGVPVGVVDLVGQSRTEEAHVATFGASVDKDRRGRGIGSALIEELVRWASAHGISRLQAYVFDTNPRALALYERHGFEQEGLLRGAVMRDGQAIDVWLVSRLV